MKIQMPGFMRSDALANAEAEALAKAHTVGVIEGQLAQARADADAARLTFDAVFDTAADADPDAPARIDKARKAMLDADGHVTALSGAVERARSGLAQKEKHHREMRDRIERQSAAAAIESQCEAIEQAAARLDAPVAALAKAVKALMPEVEAAYATSKYGKTAPITAAILAEALAHRLPELFDFVRLGTGLATQPGSGLLRGAVSQNGDLLHTFPAPANEARTAAAYVKAAMLPERSRAAAIRAGDAALPSVPKPATVPEPEPDIRPDRSKLLVVVVKPVSWTNEDGELVITRTGQTQLPRPVAEEVCRRGLGERTGTPAAAAAGERIAVDRRDRAPDQMPNASQVVHLGIELREVYAADVARQRRAAIERDGVAA